MSARTPTEDAELTARLRSPSTVRTAFDEAMRIYSEPLYWQIRRLVQSHADADDILQNTFMKAWMSIENLRGDAKLGTWLYKIAINESLTFLERERKRKHLSIDDQEAQLTAHIAADRDFDGDELARKLQEAVASLPEKQRIVFNMKYFDDMKYEDMSEILGTSVGALKASYHLATKKIEQFFEDED